MKVSSSGFWDVQLGFIRSRKWFVQRVKGEVEVVKFAKLGKSR